MSAGENIDIPRQEIADFCRRHHIKKLSFFGSVTTGSFGPESDVDVLVEFEEGFVPGFAFFGLQEELSGLLQRKVDLHTRWFLSRFFRDEVAENAEVIFDGH